MQLHKGYLPIVQQTKLTHSFHAKITQTIKKRDFFSGSVFLSFEICYAQYEENTNCVNNHNYRKNFADI